MSRMAVVFLLIAAPALAILLASLGLETVSSNLLGWFLVLIGVGYLAGGVIYFFILKKPFWQPVQAGKVAGEETGDRSFWLILPGFLAVFFASPLEWLYLPATLPRTAWLQAAGIALLLLSVAVRMWVRQHLRNQYSGHVEVQAEHRLVQTGPYRFVRHPGYTGLVLMALGVAVGYASLLGLLAIPILLLPGLAYRMGVEEKLLRQHFGEEYHRYAAATRRLIPGIW